MSEMSEYPHGVFCWVDLVAHDKAAAEEWYAGLFGWEVQRQDTGGGPPYAMFTKNGKVAAGVGQMSDEMKAQGLPPMWNSYVAVDDCEAIEERAKQLGATVTVPTMKVMEAGKLAFFVDPVGAPFAVWQKLDHGGAGIVSEPGAFCWNELNAKDVGAISEFYGSLFGWTFEETENPRTRYLTVKAGGRPNGGLLQMTEEWGDMPSRWQVYFAVDDCDAAAAKVKDTGGAVHVPPFDIGPIGRISVVADPDGAVFTVMKLASPG